MALHGGWMVGSLQRVGGGRLSHGRALADWFQMPCMPDAHTSTAILLPSHWGMVYTTHNDGTRDANLRKREVQVDDGSDGATPRLSLCECGPRRSRLHRAHCRHATGAATVARSNFWKCIVRGAGPALR